MFCLKHRWIYDLRLYHVHRKCSICGEVQRHAWNKESIYTDWEPIRESTYVESEQKQIVRKLSTGVVRLAHSLRLLRSRATDRRNFRVRSARQA